MSTQASSSYTGTPGLGSSIFVQWRDPVDGTILVARSNTGIREDAAGCYVSSKALADRPEYEAIWDEGDGTYFVKLVVPQSKITSTSPIALPAGGVSPVVTQSFFIKRGDTEPLIFAITELDATGVQHLRNVTGWTGSFKLRVAADTGTIIINQPFYISDINGVVTTDGTGGLLAYKWPNSGETDREGLYLAEFECHRADGSKKTYPTTSDLGNEYIKVFFVPDLDDTGSH